MPFFAALILCLFSSFSFSQEDLPAEPAAETTTENEVPPAEPAMAQESSEAPAESEITQPPRSRVLSNPASRRTKEVLKHLVLFQRQKEILSFSEEADTINGLYLSENTGKPQGGVLILHDIEQHAHWPNTIGPIREYLPDYGWNTLSLFFGNYIKKPMPKRPITETEEPPAADATESPVENLDVENALTEEAMSQASEEIADTTEPDENLEGQDAPMDELATIAQGMDEVQDISPNLDQAAESENIDDIDISEILLQDMQERVDTGLSQLNNLGQFNLVIIAQGLSANWAVESLVKRFEQDPELVGYALIILDAKKSNYPDYDLNENIAKLNIPILDIHTNKSPQALRKVRERRNAITRTQNERYWQIHLPAVRARLPQKHNMISRRVRGWLNTHAAGEEVDVKG